MRVVVDTNVWVSGLIVPDGVPGRILEAIRAGRIEPVISWDQADELVDVLSRPRMRRYRIPDDDVALLLFALRPFLPNVDLAVDIRNPDDVPVIAAGVAGRADAIVTGDRDLLEDPALRTWLDDRGIVLLGPSELLERLG